MLMQTVKKKYWSTSRRTIIGMTLRWKATAIIFSANAMQDMWKRERFLHPIRLWATLWVSRNWHALQLMTTTDIILTLQNIFLFVRNTIWATSNRLNRFISANALSIFQKTFNFVFERQMMHLCPAWFAYPVFPLILECLNWITKELYFKLPRMHKWFY